MTDPKFDPITGKVVFPKPEAKAVVVPTDMAYVAIPKATIVKLAKLAAKDGADLKADTQKGSLVKASKAARMYVLGAIETLLTKRGA